MQLRVAPANLGNVAPGENSELPRPQQAQRHQDDRNLLPEADPGAILGPIHAAWYAQRCLE